MNTTQADLDIQKISILLKSMGYEYIDMDIDGSLIYRKDNHDIFISSIIHHDNL